MSGALLPIADLPLDITEDGAVEAVYRDDLDWIEARLRQGMSVLVECDKQLVLYLYKALRARFKRRSGAQKTSFRLISGHVPADGSGNGPLVGGPATLTQRILQQLQEAIFGGESSHIVVIPHLDVLTTTTRSGLNAEAREAAAILYENPALVFLGFQDPTFEIPEIISDVFPARRAVQGIARDRLPSILLQREARKFAQGRVNPYALYKYLSGVNAVRARQILSSFADRVDHDPANPGTSRQILAEIRQMTAAGEVELPQVDLEADIGGYAAVKKKIQEEILDLLRQRQQASPEVAAQIDAIVPKGMIFYGPPGTGKTFFAKAIATALDATLSVVSGPELKSRWVGESEANLRRVFAAARRSAPSIIVFDELDSFASARGTYSGSGVEHSMVNQLLTEMDGFRKEELVFVVGTTNFMESLDPALLRPGRFELAIHIPYPDADDRRAILRIYRQRFQLDLSDDLLEQVVTLTEGYVDEARGIRFSGDHLSAAMRALKRAVLRRGMASGGGTLTLADVEAALERRASAVVLTAEEERTVAVHEAGHALAAYLLPHCPALTRVRIATGDARTLGYVQQAVKERRYITTRAELLDDVCVLLSGRIAEEQVLGDVSMGAWSDLQRATELCRLMVEELGMSELGLRNFRRPEGDLAASGSATPRAFLSEEAAARVDAEIDRLLQEARARAEQLLSQHRPQLDALVHHLLQEKEADITVLKRIFGP